MLGRIDGDGKIITFILITHIIFLLKPLLESCEQISMFLQGYSMTKRTCRQRLVTRVWARELDEGKITEAVTLGSSDFIQEGCDIDLFVLCCIRKITLLANERRGKDL